MRTVTVMCPNTTYRRVVLVPLFLLPQAQRHKASRGRDWADISFELSLRCALGGL